MDREQRAAKKEAARKQAASGWYRNLQGTMSFSGLQGLAIGVGGDSPTSSSSRVRSSLDRFEQDDAADGNGPARRPAQALRGAMELGTLMPPSAGPTAGE